MLFLRIGFVGFLNYRHEFLWLYVGFFVSVLFFFWTSPSFGKLFKLGGGVCRDCRRLLLWVTPVIQEAGSERVSNSLKVIPTVGVKARSIRPQAPGNFCNI